ncbi:biotin/lipoyl-binding protein [Guyparkeria sp. 1SP6A2]|nr:biotin/lipoyl-binding protein [Guyparkeria sp. 1SP6A2]
MQATDTPQPRSRPWLYRLVLPVMILAIAVAGFVALKASRPEAPAASPQERAWQVESMTIEPQRLHASLTLHGEVTNPDSLTVNAPLGARVERVPVEDGQSVQSGELLVALDERDFLPNLTRARANLADLEAQIAQARQTHRADQDALALERKLVANAQTALNRAQDLNARNLASQSDVDNARDALTQARLALNNRQERLATFEARLEALEARTEAARADVQAADRDRDRARATAPADGLVGNVAVTRGAQVSANATLLVFHPWSGFELRALIPNREVGPLLAALEDDRPPRARVLTAARSQELELVRIAGEASGLGATGIFRFESPTAQLRLGEIMTVALEMPAVDKAIAIPPSALYGNDHVYRIRDERLERVAVERLGEHKREGRSMLLIRSDALAAGDRITTTQLPNAVDGLKVDYAANSGEDQE